MPRVHTPTRGALPPPLRRAKRQGHPPAQRRAAPAWRKQAIVTALVVLAAMEASAQAVEGSRSKMFGGQAVSFRNHPWQVSLATASDLSHFCGGVLVHAEWVLTAAHCLDEVRDAPFVVRAGSERLNGRMAASRVLAAVRHPRYERSTWQNDIALLRVEPSPLWQAEARPIQGPNPEVAAGLVQLSIWATGWGISHPNRQMATNELQGAEFRAVPNAICNQAGGYTGRIVDTMLCLAGTGSGQSICNGDSGGPAVLRVSGVARLVGISSIGLQACAGTNPYSVFTRVDRYAGWVSGVTGGQVNWR